jgi:uncharacterized membrane protein
MHLRLSAMDRLTPDRWNRAMTMTSAARPARREDTAMGFWSSASLLAATVTAGLMAGLFAAFSYAIMPGLGKAGDLAFVDGMQRINVAILNGWFGICFGGALVFSVLAAGLHLAADRRSVLPWVVAGAALYLVVQIVTFAVNVPLNDKLAAAGDPARITDLHAVREQFEAVWVRWNIVRTVACTLAFGCLSWALVLHGRLSG